MVLDTCPFPIEFCQIQAIAFLPKGKAFIARVKGRKEKRKTLYKWEERKGQGMIQKGVSGNSILTKGRQPCGRQLGNVLKPTSHTTLKL